jgi:DNA-binding MarR family transcriptional regulator
MLSKTLPLKPFLCNFLINKGYEIKFKKLDDLASELNVSYRNLTRVIKELLDDEIIEKDRYSIKVIDKEAIEEYSELF